MGGKAAYTIALALILIPLAAEAKVATTWSFLKYQTGGEWQGKNIDTAQPTEHGLLIVTDQEGQLQRDTEFTHGVDTLSLTYVAETDTVINFRWHKRGTPPSNMVILPIVLEATAVPLTIDIDLTQYKQWDRHTSRVALLFRPGAQILLREMTFTGYSPFEKITYAWRSIWTYDEFRAYTINFMWGPQMSYNPIALRELFRSFPPHANSVNWVFYFVFFVGLAAIFIRFCKKRSLYATRKWVVTLLAIFAISWISYDIRMGMELISYFRDDYENFYSEEPAVKSFRDRGHFYALIDGVKPFVSADKSYVFMSQFQWPFMGLIRYYTYPSLPTSPEEAQDGSVKTWVVFERTDLTLNGAGQLMEDGNVISQPGEILHEFAPGTFLFRTNRI